MRGELRTWLDKLHNFVAKLANLWTEGSDEDRQTAARFLRDMVGSDYGKAAIGLAAGAALPHAAPLANKLLREAGELVASEQALDVAGRGAAKAIDSVVSLLAAVTDRQDRHQGPVAPPLTRDALRALLADADELLRQAIQHQRGIGIDAGTTSAELRQATDEKIRLVRDVLGWVPIRSQPKR